jgi:Gpi18-like mannosyltransferase
MKLFLELCKKHSIELIILGFLIGLIIRLQGFNYISYDAQFYLLKWSEEIQKNGLGVLTEMRLQNNYSYLYHFSIYILDTFIQSSLYSYKLFSLLFELGTAVVLFQISKLVTKDVLTRWIIVLLYWLNPVIIVNSSYLAQSDSLWSFFLVTAVYFMIMQKENYSSFLTGAGISFKLQSIFLLPTLIVFLHTKQLVKHFLLLCIGLCIFLLPGFLLTKNLFLAIQPLFIQSTTFRGSFSYGFGGFWELVQPFSQITNNLSLPFSVLGKQVLATDLVIIIGSFLAFVTIRWFVIQFKKIIINSSSKNIILVSYFFAMLVPFLLPKMHDRYYYFADVLSCFIIILSPKLRMYAFLGIVFSFTLYFGQLNLEKIVAVWAVSLFYLILLVKVYQEIIDYNRSVKQS